MLIIAVIPAVVLGGFYYQYFSGVLLSNVQQQELQNNSQIIYHLGQVGARTVHIEIQSAVDSVWQNDRQKLAARAEVEGTQHTQHRSYGAAEPRPGQVGDEQRTKEAAQQVERCDGQGLVVVHVLYPGHK